MDRTYEHAFTLTMSPEVITNISPKAQVNLVNHNLHKLLVSVSTRYKYVLEFTKKGNVHIHGMISFDSHQGTIESFIILIRSFTMKYIHTKIKVFGSQICIKKIFNITEWDEYIHKDIDKTKYIFTKLKLIIEPYRKWEISKQIDKLIFYENIIL